jgi:membrane-associated phospholipid phosphatase
LNSGFLYKLARITTNIFVPPVNTLILFVIIIFYQFESKQDQILALSVAFLFSFFLPILFFIWLRRKDLVADVDATNKEERTIPYLFGILLCIIALLISYFFWGFTLFSKIWLIYSVNTIWLIAINKFWKISAHAIGMSAPIGVLFFVFGQPSLIALVLLLYIGWTRLYLKKHTISQIIAGSIFGFFLTYLQLLIY